MTCRQSQCTNKDLVISVTQMNELVSDPQLIISQLDFTVNTELPACAVTMTGVKKVQGKKWQFICPSDDFFFFLYLIHI